MRKCQVSWHVIVKFKTYQTNFDYSRILLTPDPKIEILLQRWTSSSRFKLPCYFLYWKISDVQIALCFVSNPRMCEKPSVSKDKNGNQTAEKNRWKETRKAEIKLAAARLLPELSLLLYIERTHSTVFYWCYYYFYTLRALIIWSSTCAISNFGRVFLQFCH